MSCLLAMAKRVGVMSAGIEGISQRQIEFKTHAASRAASHRKLLAGCGHSDILDYEVS